MEKERRITEVPRIGKAAAEDLSSLGIRTLSDMILFRPRAYDDRRDERTVRMASVSDSTISCRIVILSHSEFPTKKGLTLKVTAEDDDGTRLEILCFNRGYLKAQLAIGTEWYIFGKVQRIRGRFQTSSFEIKRTKEEAGIGRILPVYPLTGNLTEKMMRAAAYYSLMALSPIPDELPQRLYEEYSLLHHDEAYKAIHFPDTLEEAGKALRTLAFTELLMMEIMVLRESIKPAEKKKSTIFPIERKLLEALPFRLTPDQEKSAEEIREDMDSGIPMNRLLQGDVGSGKTLVAWLSALHAIAQGGQVAFMAPTELLARQHADGAAALLASLGIRIAFITGSVKGESRRLLLKSLKDGSTDLVIGTHALFSEDVEFRNLRFVIIDEQHRFGVQQREALMKKGRGASILSMSATPIPRSLALTLYAAYSVSTLHTMPSGRRPITTYLVQEDRREEMYKAVGVEFSRGHQAYFVYPRIDDDGESELRDVTTMYEVLKKEYPDTPSALLHSKLPDDEKMRILHDFKDRKLAYLVSTSVVEVGIDIPDATCMVIEHAERFGLAALHQLRGRVGRSSLPSYCFLVYGKNLTDEAKARLKVMKETTDGFRIAEKDLEIRGPGDITGDKQSGFLRLKFASLTSDLDIVEKARNEAERIIKDDRGLLKAENAVLRNNLPLYRKESELPQKKEEPKPKVVKAQKKKEKTEQGFLEF